MYYIKERGFLLQVIRYRNIESERREAMHHHALMYFRTKVSICNLRLYNFLILNNQDFTVSFFKIKVY